MKFGLEIHQHLNIIFNMIEVIKSDIGYFMGYSNDLIFKKLKNNEPQEYSIINFIKNNITKNDICIEVGANIGAISVYLSKFCKKLYCFEPQHNIYFALCGNLFLNECYNVETFEAAASHKNTKFSIAAKEKLDCFVGDIDKGFHNVNSFGSISVEEKENGDILGLKIDDVININERIAFIKTDAEGGDLNALIGAKNIINKYKPTIIFEFHPDNSLKCYNQNWQNYLDFFKEINYKLLRLDDSNILALPN